MIKLFRNIRQNLLAEGKTSRYLKYAIGEIILVVIGILIALSINNWNETRKERFQEVLNLKNIQKDILLDTVDIGFNLKYHKLVQSTQKQLLNNMQSEDSKPKEALKYEYALGTPLILILHESSFNNLKDNNINIISNQELKKQISNHYDNIASIMLRVENDLDDYKTYTFLKPYFLKYFSSENKKSKFEAADFNPKDYYSYDMNLNALILTDSLGLKKDSAFKIELAESIKFLGFKIDMYSNFLDEIHKLNDSITKELKKIE